ncbi:MAG: beta-aspartyl-peptidase [Firmicutes bacterium]|nr:beta-aspartyl-peptidase [Bacillota bacterium]
MLKLIKGAEIYNPDYLGKKDILICNDKIIKIENEIVLKDKSLDVEVMDVNGKIVTPGFIDQHVHLIGGGGEGGFHTRTPEIMLSDIIKSGVTTVVGLLGTDGTNRSLESLLAKAKGLDNEGITTYILTGSYELPSPTLTGTTKKDIVLIDKVLGTKIALSDHRSSWPTKEEIIKLVTNNRVGGMLSNKQGVLVMHMGDAETRLKIIFEILNETTLPIKHFLPTHVNRNKELFTDAIEFAKKGGVIDLTSGIVPTNNESNVVKPSKALKRCLLEGVSIDNITMSSDSNGSKPEYDKYGNLLSMGVGTMDNTLKELKDMVNKEHIDFSDAIKLVTSNVSKLLGINENKGNIKVGSDADMIVFSKELDIDIVLARGKTMLKNNKILVKGTYEK